MDNALHLFSLLKSSLSLISSWAAQKYITNSNKILAAELNSDNQYLLFNSKPAGGFTA